MFLVLIWSLSAFASSFSDSLGRFKLDYPDNWEISRKTAGNDPLSQGVLISLQRKNADDRYHPRFSVVVEETRRFGTTEPKGRALYQNYATEFLKSQRFQIQNQKDTTVSGNPALEVTAFQRDFGLTYRQWIVIGPSDSAYLLTAAARVKSFESYAAEFDKMAQSFKMGFRASH